MAQKIQTLFIDDIDGTEAEGTVRFGLDGAEYEIDLNAKHADALRKALAKYIDAARRSTGTARRPARHRAQGVGQRGEYDGSPRVGQGTGHRGQGPRAGASRIGGQVPGGNGQLGLPTVLFRGLQSDADPCEPVCAEHPAGPAGLTASVP